MPAMVEYLAMQVLWSRVFSMCPNVRLGRNISLTFIDRDLIWFDTHLTVKCTNKAATYYYDVACKLLYKCTAAISN